MGIKCAEGREVHVGNRLGEALGEPRAGLTLNLGIQTPGLARPPGVDGRASEAGQGPGTQVTLAVPTPLAPAARAAELTVAEEPRDTGTLEVVILAKRTLIAAFAVAHAVAALALATPRARLVLALPQTGLYVTQRAGGAAAGAAAPKEGVSHVPTA